MDAFVREVIQENAMNRRHRRALTAAYALLNSSLDGAVAAGLKAGHYRRDHKRRWAKHEQQQEMEAIDRNLGPC
jgi:hypothetical protein